ncbi:type 1 glutamine amidotransferase domain-containing protein [Aminobacterium mobile]|uniref:type 1 glutamine amidotransferase domain-containing protein n=1 Tax=Aminobacterium mobile TaxID=81467 RepID=UPI0033160E69
MARKGVVILVEDGFNDLEYWYPFYRLVEEGYAPIAVAPVAPHRYTGKYGTTVDVTYTAQTIMDNMPKALVIPGGWAPDKLRMSADIVALVHEIYKAGGIIASICHGGSLLVSAGILQGKKVTSFPSIKDDMKAAGAQWVDEQVVISDRIITSRKPADLPFFTKALLEILHKG